MVTRGDELALLAGAVGEMPRAPLALERLGKDARHGGLTGAARAAEQVGMARAALGDGPFERGDDMLLAHDVLERLRAIFPVERFHGALRRFG